MKNKVKRCLLWFVLLNKRFLKKPLLLFLLCLIPLTALLARIIPSAGGTLLQVGVCSENKEDRLAASVIRSLVRSKSSRVVRYVPYGNGDLLRDAVRSGDIQLGFLFPDDLSALVNAYAKISAEDSSDGLRLLGQALGMSKSADADLDGMKEHAIRVICASNDIVTKLEKEQLFGNLYAEFGDAVLKAWMDVHAPDESESVEERDRFLENALARDKKTGNFFRLAYLNGDAIDDGDLDRYDLAPLRGLLAITLILICFAACLFLMQDNRKGLFVWLRPIFRPFFHFLYLLIPVIDGGLFAYLALRISNVPSGSMMELPAWILYLFSVTGFSNLIRVLTGKLSLFSSTIPIVIMGCLFLTPVFLDLRILPAVQMLLPPYFYLKSLHEASALAALLAYAGVFSAGSILLDFLKNRQ